ncbi:uncharacterized protein [Macrobrachium rosenbergii]|uniref:uncharacterized protein n=1 Tax=Macrobrachium rosenbergii TaxID=79674 RepID=UPI0034D75FB3
MRLLIICVLPLLPTASPRRDTVKEKPVPDTEVNAFSGKELPCGEHHLPLKQKFFIDWETAQEECQWTLRVHADTTNIKIRCNTRLRESENCRDAYVQLFDGWRIKHKYCGKRSNISSHSGTGLMVVKAVGKTSRFSRKELGTFGCEISTELKPSQTVKGPEEPEEEEELPLPPPLSLLERIFSLFMSESS